MIWQEIVNKSNREGLQIHQSFQKEIQKAILTALSHEGAFNHIVFHGGTALNLFYGNPRFSEDLDFALKQEKTSYDLTQKITKLQTFITDNYPFLKKTQINIQKKDKNIQRLIIKTISDVPQQKLRIHLELACIPSYLNQPKILDYPPLNPAVTVEDASEILADKITALGYRSYLKGRDLWDIHFLVIEKQITIPWTLVIQKTKDYGNTPETLKENLFTAQKKIKKEGSSILTNEMKRFLPKTILDQYSDTFDEITTKVTRTIEEVKKIKL